MARNKILSSAVLSAGFLFCVLTAAVADTLYLNNGRSIDGFIKHEDEKSVELDVGFGTVTFQKAEIKEVRRSTLTESARLRQKWEEDKDKAKEAKSAYQRQPRHVGFEQDKDRIVVSVVLNGSVKASLILDTGATFVVLSPGIAKALGVDLDKEKRTVDMQLADGRKVQAKYLLLESIGVQDMEAEKVEAAVMPEESQDPSLGDGILGMSFLKRFNFKVDYTNGRLVLEKI